MPTWGRYLMVFLILLIGYLAYGFVPSGRFDLGLAIALALGGAIGQFFYDRRRSSPAV